jgi:hypothetical protein
MNKRFLGILLGLVVVSFPSYAGDKNPVVASPDKAYLQKIWDGWGTLDPAYEARFHAQGPNTFYDESPLKYGSWAEFQQGVSKILATMKRAKFTVNDDAQLHPAGRYVWGTATVNEDIVMKDGKNEKGILRWTVVFEEQKGKWLIVHEHISQSAP